MEENTFIIGLEDGREVECRIILTFEMNKKQYVVFEDPQDEDEEIYCGSYDDNGELNLDLSEEELQSCQEVYEAFSDEEEA